VSDIISVAAINDMSGSGRCSLTAAMPILGAFGLQCCALPTAILSNHTGYDKYFFDDYTDKMERFIEDWKAYDMHFGCIYTGFLGSEKQIDIAEKFFDTFREKDTKVLVDPVMGDDGKIYSTYTYELCNKMKRLISHADVVTPNVTEASILSGIEYCGDSISSEKARAMAECICKLGTQNVVITGIKRDGKAINYIYSPSGEHEYSSPMVPVYYSGTGEDLQAFIAKTDEVLYEAMVTGKARSLQKSKPVGTHAAQYGNKRILPKQTVSGGSFFSYRTIYPVERIFS